VKVGVALPTNLHPHLSMADAARRAEDAGFDSVWINDHVLMPESVASWYPFSKTGEVNWPLELPWVDSVVAMALAAAVTERVEVCTGVMVAPLRQPLVLAKQIASLDEASNGRIVLGVGAGWLAEEFEALEIPYAERGKRLEEMVAIMRASWSGRTPRHRGIFEVPSGAHFLPTPKRNPPILFGGGASRALARAGRLGQGYIGVIDATLDAETAFPLRTDDAGLDALAADLEAIYAAADEHGRRDEISRIVTHVFGSHEDVARALPRLAGVGVNEIIVQDPGWDDPGSTVAMMREASAGPRSERN
jgi:probable F420-dependent oxidoreductase